MIGAPALRSQNGLNLEAGFSVMDRLSIFDIGSDWLVGEIYLHGLKVEVREILTHLGVIAKTCRAIGVPYVALQEWPRGRKPISIKHLKQLIGLCSPEFRVQIKSKIDSADILLSCRYSPWKVRFPKEVSPDLAYCVGLMLGDGSLSGDSPNSKGNWIASMFLDNYGHQKLYDSIILKEFGVALKRRMDSENCYQSYFCSKAFHWFLRSYFEIGNGFKSAKIFVPKKILNSSDGLIVPFLQGLFDSDGTITVHHEVKYASTSKLIVEQVAAILESKGMECRISMWLKAARYLPLYTVQLRNKNSVLKFAKEIGFRHPIKLARLSGVQNKHLVAPSSSGHKNAVQ